MKNSNGRHYLRIVENIWNKGKRRSEQKILFTLGRLDKLQATGQIDSIMRSLSRFCEKIRLVDLSKDVSVEETYIYGSVYVLKKLFERTPLQRIAEDILKSHEQLEMSFVDVVFAMIASRFVKPCSKLSLKERWLDRLYPEMIKSDLALHHLYRSLDLLAEHKEDIQRQMIYPDAQHSLFDTPRLELVFYDTTTLRFESVRTDSGELRRFGYSKELRTDCTQVILGLMLDCEGLPVGYKLFPGNTYEGKTLPLILNRLKELYQIRRLIFVADRGMINAKNLDEIVSAGFEFIMGMKLWAMKDDETRQISEIREWDYTSENYKVKEMEHPDGRLIITWSRDRAIRDIQARSDILKKLQIKLSRENRPEKLISHRGYGKYLKVIKQGEVALDEEAIQNESLRDGLFGILTNVSKEDLSAKDIVDRYKELWKIEDAFGEIKGTMEARPMFHWTDKRIEGHMMVCFLAYYLEALVTKLIKEADCDFSAPSAFDALNQIRAVPVEVRGQTIWVRTKIEGIAAKVIQALKIRMPGDVLKLPYEKKHGDSNFCVDQNRTVNSTS
jgi:transposase